MTDANEKALDISGFSAKITGMNTKQSKAKSALILRHINSDVISRVQEDGRLHVSTGDQDYLVSGDGRIYDATGANWMNPTDLLNDLSREFDEYHKYHNLDNEPNQEGS